MYDSLEAQSFHRFGIIYIDDASDEATSQYIRLRLEHSNIPYTYEKNTERKGSLYNLVFAMQKIAVNPASIIVCLDDDDAFMIPEALQSIVDEYDKGCDLSVGNCFRTDKPAKKYTITSFKYSSEKEGNNLWLHPKTFRRQLFDRISIDDLKINGEFIDVNTDYAFMLPLIAVSKQPAFISDVLYYFDPSTANRSSMGKYGDMKRFVMEFLLKKHQQT